MANEIWKVVPGYENYEVSDQGQVRNRRTSRLLTPTGAYAGLALGRARKVRVHTLVLEAFIGPRPEGQQCRHMNGDKRDNRLSNLRWGTSQENHDDALRLGERPFGSRCPQAKLTESAVLVIRNSTEPVAVLAERYGVSKSVISEVRNHKAWVHVGSGT